MKFFKPTNINRDLKSYETRYNNWNLDVSQMTIGDCRKRLDDFIAARASQRKYLESFFESTFDIKLQGLFEKDKLQAVTDELDQWCHKYLLPAYDKRYKYTEFFLTRPFPENQKIMILMSDLGFYFGDAVLHHSKSYEWSIIEGLKQGDYFEFQRPVLSDNTGNFFDIERLTFTQFVNFKHEFKIFKEAFGKNRAYNEMHKDQKFTGHLRRFLQQEFR